MILLGLIVLVGVIIILIFLITSAEENKYRHEPILSEPNREIKIGPLEYPIQNKSTLTYRHLGYLGNSGNQLFEIAATLAIAYQNKCRVVFPSSLRTLPIYKMFDLSHLPIQDLEHDARIFEFDNYEEINIPNDGRIYNLEGYRQSYLYFEPIKEYLRNLFPLKIIPPKENNYIAIHIRRTDFIKTPFLQKFLKLQLNCSFDYYRSALLRIREENQLPENTPVIIATDDPKWVKSHLQEIDPQARLNNAKTIDEDFSLMYYAPYLVITNSTFSLWAAFLNEHKQIIAPSYWWHPDGVNSLMNNIHRQPICRPSWNFNDPLTGEIVKQSYHWGPEYWSNPSWFNRTVRAIFATNTFRKRT